MGTNYAVEVALHAHANLLYRAGCLREHERVAYRKVFPKGPGFDLLCIDDHVFLLVIDLSEVGRTPSPSRRDAKLFAQASEAYLRAGLRVSAKKKVRNATQGTIRGELDGIRGDLAAPRLRTTALGCLTFQLVLLGFCTKDLLQCIVGCWVFVCMFRRPFMCLLTQVYHEMRDRAGSEVFKLSHDARQELLALVLLSPCIFTDLRAAPLDRIFCTDASGFAAGACQSSISRAACLDLLRYADHKGYHTALLPKSAELIARLGDQGGFEALHQDLPPQLTEGVIFDLVEIFRGEGNLSLVASEFGLRVHPGFDVSDGPSGDVMSSACFDQIAVTSDLSSFTRAGAKLFGDARILELQLPSIQLLRHRDVDDSRPASTPPRWIADLGSCLPWKTLFQYRFARANHININEELSYRSLVKHLAKVAADHRFGILLDSRVVIGCNTKGRSSSAKLNYYLSTGLPYLVGGNLYLSLFHVGTHENAADDPSRLKPLRPPSGCLPLWLRRFLAGDTRYLAAVKLADDRRGPVGGWSRLVVLLSLLSADASPRDQLFQQFRSWAELELDCSFNQLCSTGLLLCTVLVAYGKFLFYGGSPRYIFSETINACTDQFKHYRQFFSAAWSVLTRWQEEEPGERSMVIPVSVFKAAVALALLWSWPLFAAGLLLGFNGLLRPGEFLLLRRRDLILPQDLLTDLPLAYVRIVGGKTRRYMQRQHAKISDAITVNFLSSLFGHLPPEEPLFNCSPFVFRSRWDAIFRHLGVPTSDGPQGVTPKCLRGSGATWMYQLTEDIPRIQWRGRWQQRRTLEHCLQDVAGQLLLADLAESHRFQIVRAGPLFCFAGA
ncbi:SUF4 [Symbiodinium sp. CCMP2592]|nr:SUF4 [Symbiodinium sp. CCMP2592]